MMAFKRAIEAANAQDSAFFNNYCINIRNYQLDHQGLTLAGYLAFKGCENEAVQIQWLVEQGAHYSGVAEGYALAGKTKAVKQWIARGASIDWVVYATARRGAEDYVSALLNKGASKDWAARGYAYVGNKQKVLSLIDEGAGVTPIAVAAMKGGQFDLVEALLTQYGRYNGRMAEIIQAAAHVGHEHYGCTFENKAGFNKWIAMGLAAAGKLESLERFLKNKAPIPYQCLANAAAKCGQRHVVNWFTKKIELSTRQIAMNAAEGGHYNYAKQTYCYDPTALIFSISKGGYSYLEDIRSESGNDEVIKGALYGLSHHLFKKSVDEETPGNKKKRMVMLFKAVINTQSDCLYRLLKSQGFNGEMMIAMVTQSSALLSTVQRFRYSQLPIAQTRYIERALSKKHIVLDRSSIRYATRVRLLLGEGNAPIVSGSISFVRTLLVSDRRYVFSYLNKMPFSSDLVTVVLSLLYGGPYQRYQKLVENNQAQRIFFAGLKQLEALGAKPCKQ